MHVCINICTYVYMYRHKCCVHTHITYILLSNNNQSPHTKHSIHPSKQGKMNN